MTHNCPSAECAASHFRARYNLNDQQWNWFKAKLEEAAQPTEDLRKLMLEPSLAECQHHFEETTLKEQHMMLCKKCGTYRKPRFE